MARLAASLAIVLLASAAAAAWAARPEAVIRLPSDFLQPRLAGEDGDDATGTKWAVLIAGSTGYGNYRHQADICHAYQILKRGGLKDENIIVFMYDDIAYNYLNPYKGTIVNKPYGPDVYAGVPKDYIGDDVTVKNFLAVLSGNRSALHGQGSGKVVDSGPNDNVFIFYSDHGGPGVLGIPVLPYLYADELNDVLKRKFAAGGFKSLVFYLEACEAGSMFEGLLPTDINVYATTAANAVENSWGTYCPGQTPGPPDDYGTCMGDLYSVSWMEDSDANDLTSESLRQQYEIVKTRTSVHNTYAFGSHVTQYGDLYLNIQHVSLYLGAKQAIAEDTVTNLESATSSSGIVGQRDADLVHYWHRYLKSSDGSSEKLDAQKQLVDVLAHRLHVDKSVELIGNLLFGPAKGSEVLGSVRPSGLALVDDWVCLRSMVRTFESRCGSLSQYGLRHMRAFANMCNAGIHPEGMATIAAQACPAIPDNPWSSLSRGFSA